MFLFVKMDSNFTSGLLYRHIADLWLRNLILNSLDVEPTY